MTMDHFKTNFARVHASLNKIIISVSILFRLMNEIIY